jgi:hypothetical protein
MKCLVLTYHSHNILGANYCENDHVALAMDLEILHRFGIDVVPLSLIADAVASGEDSLRVGLSFDDGPLFDFSDFVHPRFGPQRGFLNILRDFRAAHGKAALPGLHATSFVIASPYARKCMELSEGPSFPENWLADDWWVDALDSGLMDIGNHSWDHVHHAVSNVAIGASARDNFEVVDNFDDAEREIRAASDFINTRIGRTTSLFAFPFGHVNSYLVSEYLPCHGPSFGLRAAFRTGLTANLGDSVWNIPRVVCGHDWRSPRELEGLLARSA